MTSKITKLAIAARKANEELERAYAAKEQARVAQSEADKAWAAALKGSQEADYNLLTAARES